MIALTLYIGGQLRQAYATPGTLHVHDQLTSRNTMEFQLFDASLSDVVRPIVGQPVILLDTDGVTRLFAGSVDSVDEMWISGVQNYLTYTVHCVDYNQICDRFLVANTYIDPAQTLSTIVLDIVNNTLLGESISTAGVQTGPIIPETKIFNYKTATQVFNELSTLTNYVWWIDYNKVMYFVPRTGASTSLSLDTTNVLSMTVTTSRSVGPYRNKQYVRAGTAETSSRTEILTGDGKRKSYNTTFDIERGPTKGQPPTILLNGATQTVGTKGIDTSKQFYWTRGSNQVVLDDSLSALSNTDQLSVTYIGRYPSIVQAQLDDEIASRRTVEGGSGIYMALKTDRNLNDIIAQQNLARSILQRYGFIPQQVKVVTDVVGIRSGQLIALDFPTSSVSGNFLVQEVQADDQQGTFMRYNVTLVDG